MEYRIQEEIVNLAKDVSSTNTYNYLSDMRVAKFGTNRRSEHIGSINALGGSGNKWHDSWEEYLRSKSVDNSQYIEEERAVFHKTNTY